MQQILPVAFADGLEHVTDIKLEKCMYIQDECLQRLSETSTLQRSLQQLKIISCGNVTDKGILALHKLKYVRFGGFQSPLLWALWDCWVGQSSLSQT